MDTHCTLRETGSELSNIMADREGQPVWRLACELRGRPIDRGSIPVKGVDFFLHEFTLQRPTSRDRNIHSHCCEVHKPHTVGHGVLQVIIQLEPHVHLINAEHVLIQASCHEQVSGSGSINPCILNVYTP
jgi:hypothetical protein